MTPKMVAALKAARDAGDEGLHWTRAGWQPPAGGFDYHGGVIVSRLVHWHGFIAERGSGRGKNARRVITDAGRAWLEKNGHAAPLAIEHVSDYMLRQLWLSEQLPLDAYLAERQRRGLGEEPADV